MSELKPGAWVLMLNDMRSPKFEWLTAVCQADDAQELLDLLERERVPTYRDGRWAKSFRQGGPLEWYNTPSEWQMDQHVVQYQPPRAPQIPTDNILPPALTRWDRLIRPDDL